ncbi:hypothetical protein [Dyadobacter soli]|nr:hypothetical protein [Dyadobacter soli]
MPGPFTCPALTLRNVQAPGDSAPAKEAVLEAGADLIGNHS